MTRHRGFKPNIFQLGLFVYPSTSNPQYFFSTPKMTSMLTYNTLKTKKFTIYTSYLKLHFITFSEEF